MILVRIIDVIAAACTAVIIALRLKGKGITIAAFTIVTIGTTIAAFTDFIVFTALALLSFSFAFTLALALSRFAGPEDASEQTVDTVTTCLDVLALGLPLAFTRALPFALPNCNGPGDSWRWSTG
jgi:hypothetical protein